MCFCQSARPYGWRVGKSLMSSRIQAKPVTCAVCPSARKRSTMPRWSSTSIVRDVQAARPRAVEVLRSSRRSTIATSTPASASSAASISP